MPEGLIGGLSKGSGWVTTWLARVGAVLLAGIMLLTFFDVVGRGFNHPIIGAVEVTELLMGLIIYLGVGFTTLNRGHIRVDIVIIYLPVRARNILEIFTLAFSIAFSMMLCRQLWIKAMDTFGTGDKTQVWGIPIWPVVYVMAAASIFMILGLVVHFVLAVMAVIQGEEVS